MKPGPGGRPVVPPAGPVAFPPPSLATSKVEKALPGTVADVAVGGGGRYLVLHLSKQRKLAVFDVQGLALHYVSLAEDNVKFTAGREKLVVVLPDKNIIQRWDLATRKRELATTLPDVGPIRGALMGSASAGPVLVGGGRKARLLDLKTFRPVELTGAGSLDFGDHYTKEVRVSADNTVWTFRHPGLSPSGLDVLVIQGRQVKHARQHTTVGHILPGPVGKVVYTGTGRFTTDAKALDPDARGFSCYPSLHPNYYFSIRFGDRFARGTTKPVLSVHLAGNARPLLTLPDVEVPVSTDRFGRGRDSLGLDKRIHLIPQAKVFAVLPITNDRVVLYRFDVEQALEKAGIDYLFVSSTPPAHAYKGKPFVYPMGVKSKKGGVQYKLESGPKGMAVTTKGVLYWKVPADFAEGTAGVIVSVTDRTAQEVFHTFDLTVREGKDDPGPMAKLPEEAAKPPQTAPEPGPAPPEGPAAPAIAIGPPALDKDRVERPLPSSIADVVVGGRGRYLILSLPRVRKLGILDANAGRVVKFLPLAQDSPKIAAGLNHLFVAYPDKNIIQRYNLRTFERELTATLPIGAPVAALCMGSASSGPLLVCGGGDHFRGGGSMFLDPRTLRPTGLEPGKAWGGFRVFAPKLVRASGDGTLFATRHGVGSEPHEVSTLLLAGNRLTPHRASISSSLLVPGPRGKFVYTASGVFSPEMKPIFPRDIGRNQSTAKPFLPAAHGSFFMQLDPGTGDGSGSLSFFLPGQTTPIVRINNLEGIRSENISYGTVRDTLTHDQRVHYIPDAKLLVAIPGTNDRLVLRRLDVMGEVEKSDIDYLIVTSEPPATVRKGRAFRYQIVVKSKKGGIRYKLESGPEGMKLSPTGALSWAVPRSHADGRKDVIVSVRDAANQERFHTFSIQVE